MAGAARIARALRRRPDRGLGAAVAIACAAALLAPSCARRPRAIIPAGEAVPGVERFLAHQASLCASVVSYRASGTLTVSMSGVSAEAEETFLYRAPDLLRLDLAFPGYLWVPPSMGRVLVRGDSLYVSVPGLIEPWHGTRGEFLDDWSWRALVVLGIIAELDPRGPLGCDPRGRGLVVREAGDGRVALEAARDGVAWARTLARDDGRPVRDRFGPVGGGDAGTVHHRRLDRVEGLALPSELDFRYDSQDLFIHIEQDVQHLNPPLDPLLFEPAGLDRGAGG